MKVLVGLGNPGLEYEYTRHNVGFLALDEAARILGFRSPRKQLRGEIMEGWTGEQRIVLFKPATYMNLSGEAVFALIHWYKLSPEDVMIFSDDIDLPPGFMRIRKKGGAGTHNGWRSILQVTGSQSFPRARIGIGSPAPGWDLKDWVLSRWDKSPQSIEIQAAISLAARAGLCFLENNIELVMNRFNIISRKNKENEPIQTNSPLIYELDDPIADKTKHAEKCSQHNINLLQNTKRSHVD
jgi:PTH1 family peptidyl-tRNA hydrolase